MKAKQSIWAKRWLPILIFILGTLLSLAMARFAQMGVERSAHARFHTAGSDAALQVERRFAAYVEVLVGLRALFNTTDGVSREQFQRYAEALNLRRSFPGFQVLNYAVRVPAAEREAFEQRMRQEGGAHAQAYANFSIRASRPRSDYFPLIYLAPMAGNQAALGRDLADAPRVLEALLAARDSGELLSSGKVVQTWGPNSYIGLAMRLPVYKPGAPLETVEQRRAAYVGSVGAGFRVSSILDGLVKDQGLRVSLFDGGPSTASNVPSPTVDDPAALLFDSGAVGGVKPAEDDFTHLASFRLGGRAWWVRVSQPRAVAMGSVDRMLPYIVLIGGMLISGLLASVMQALTTSRSRAVGLARSMTHNLRTSERRLAEAQRLAGLGSWILDAQAGSLHCSREACRIYGFNDKEDVPSLDMLLARVPQEEREAFHAALLAAQGSGNRSEIEHRLVTPTGGERWVHTLFETTREKGQTLLCGTVRDETLRKRAALRLTLAHTVSRTLALDSSVEDALQAILTALCTQLRWDCAVCWKMDSSQSVHCMQTWSFSDDVRISHFVEASQRLTYRSSEGLLQRSWHAGSPIWTDLTDSERSFSREAMAVHAGLRTCLLVPIVSGSVHAALEFYSSEVRAVDPDMIAFMRSVASQIGQFLHRKQVESTLRYLASHDELTGLANRTLLHDRIGHAVKRCMRSGKHLAVMFLDVDRFKKINDTLGHGTGDTLLRECAKRLTGCLRQTDTVARFGGDEFVVLLEDLDAPTDATSAINKILGCYTEPFRIDTRELHVTASMGVAVYPADGADAEALLKNADAAMYRAKETGRSTYHFYSAQMNAEGALRLELEGHLRHALERNELFLVYQPKLDLHTHSFRSVEALMRWRHPELGLISPAEFIPLAEETGLIDVLGRWALQTACEDVRKWKSQGHPLQVSVNLSARQLNQPRIVTDVSDALAASGLSASMLELEITESAVMQNPGRAALLLNQLRDLGVSLAIDDFGTGYSSLSYLKRFPLCTLKIDRSFVKDLPNDGEGAALTGGIIGLAHGLNMRVVAEGVETVDQLAYLRAHGCDEIQGFLISKPIPASDIPEFLSRDPRLMTVSVVAA